MSDVWPGMGVFRKQKGVFVGEKILVVDDAMFMRGVLRSILEENGHTVIEEAENGMEAIQKYVELKPDLVTMDITMPDMTGLEAVKAIRQIDGNARIIMCSAMGQNAMVMEAMKNGALDFIIKPFKVFTVMEAIRRCEIFKKIRND